MNENNTTATASKNVDASNGGKHYRDSDSVNILLGEIKILKDENAELKRKLSSLHEEVLPNWSGFRTNCKKCGLMVQNDGDKLASGPNYAFVPAYRPSWFMRLFGVKFRQARMKRMCRLCNAVYYELPNDVSEKPPVSTPKSEDTGKP